jgi:predicted phosphodiesterase
MLSMRVLVISDIHANLVALETVLGAAAGQYDVIWCLGDVVGYGPKPNECVALVREKAALCVIGNHDWAALDRPGINVDDFNPHARHAVLWTQEQLTSSSRSFLDALADKPARPDAERSLLVTHASPREPVWEYILTPTIALENFAAFEEQICLVGHTHKPVIFVWRLRSEQAGGAQDDDTLAILDAGDTQPGNTQPGDKAHEAPAMPPGGQVAVVSMLQPTPGVRIQLAASPRQRLILNPGSVGQPRDNDARAAYALLDLEKGTWCSERVPYPVELTQNQMREARLPRRLIDRLSFGW